MISFPSKRIFGLVGPPRAGKDLVAQFLQETRGFKIMAFADKIKEEFGISKEDFEAAKISGDIEQIRKDLWDFSAKKKAENPTYFIDSLIEEAVDSEESVVISDIRTPRELSAVCYSLNEKSISRIYQVTRMAVKIWDEAGHLEGSKLLSILLRSYEKRDELRTIMNNYEGIYKFNQYLDKFFFVEDIMDLESPSGRSDEYDPPKQTKCRRNAILKYSQQYEIRIK